MAFKKGLTGGVMTEERWQEVAAVAISPHRIWATLKELGVSKSAYCGFLCLVEGYLELAVLPVVPTSVLAGTGASACGEGVPPQDQAPQ